MKTMEMMTAKIMTTMILKKSEVKKPRLKLKRSGYKIHSVFLCARHEQCVVLFREDKNLSSPN